jgi:predicted porin
VPGDGLDSGRLLSAHALYQAGDFALRAMYASWSFDGAAVELAGNDEQSGWYLEPSYRLGDRWGVYARFEDLEAARTIDRFRQWEAGFSYWPAPNVVVKFDYRNREHEVGALSGQDFDALDIGLGYSF